MKRSLRILKVLVVSLGLLPGLGGCTYYVAPGVYETSPQSTFDRSWSAAMGALADEGVQIVQQDRAGGQARGIIGTSSVTVDLRPQGDGSVRVEFNTSGGTDPSLNDRIVRSYNRRMGR